MAKNVMRVIAEASGYLPNCYERLYGGKRRSVMPKEIKRDLPKIKVGKLLASYTDDAGYTITITGGVKPNDGYTTATGFMQRYGTMHIISPSGRKVKAGYWMDWPEKEWHITDRKYNKMTWEERAALEVKQQATAYDSLRSQFKVFSRR